MVAPPQVRQINARLKGSNSPKARRWSYRL